MKLPADIVIVGAGGHAKVVIATVEAAGGRVVGAYDDRRELWGKELLGVPILGPVDSEELEGVPAIIAIGNNQARREVANKLNARWVTVVHPSAVVHTSAALGAGTVVFAGSIVQPGTTIGAHGIVNTGASVDHDCVIGSFAHIAPGARLCGGVVAGEGTMIGVGASVAPTVEIGAWAVVGAGAACVTNVPDLATVGGVPARPLGVSG
jgi:sugar O-acyltransferase (sialic acid O-acetyltransferase NeuD family)